MNSKRTTQLDKHVGLRLRALRESCGFSQDEIGQEIGVSFQQLQKYEHGNNRISAARLFELAQILGVEIDAFFEGVDRTSTRKLRISSRIKSRSDLADLIAQINDPLVRKRIVSLIRALAAERGEATSAPLARKKSDER